MKIRTNWWLCSAVVLGLGACKDKDVAKAPEVPVAVEPAVPAAPAVAAVPQVAPVVKVPAMSAAERAAKLGFVQHLTPDTEVVLAFHKGKQAVDRVTSSKLWKLVKAQSGLGMDEEAAGAAPEEAAEPSGPAALFGTEFTIALGKTYGAQAANLLTFYRRMGYFQMRALAKSFAASAKSGDFAAMENSLAQSYGPDLMKDMLADSESGVALIERLKMPPLYLAFRTSAAARATATQQLAAMVDNLGMLGEMVEPVEVERAGQKFVGQKISGAKIAESMAKDRAEMDEMIEPAAVDKLLAALAKQDIVVVSGTLGDYALLFIGASVDDLKFAADPGQSLLAGNALEFCDAYATKDLAAVMYGEKEGMDHLIAAAGGLADLTGGLRDGLSGSEGLGDTRDLEALLRMVGERENALRKLAGNEAVGVAAYFDNGLKIESYGGNDSGAVDWKASNQLSGLGDADDVVMFANMTTEAAYDEKARAYMEALLETTYAVAMKVSEVKVEDEKMTRFQEMAKMFDSKFRPDVVAMWDAMSGNFDGSLGSERACIVDLNGAVPALPGIPKPVVEQGKFPRISMVAPVTDRAKLAASWQKMNASVTSILAKISDLTGKDIPMQKPISSEKGGYATWFFSLPFFNDDFMPSVTVGDQWFAASTSKNQALDLVAKAAKGGPTRTGLYFTVNFKALMNASRETLKVVDQNSAAIFGEAAVPADKLTDAGKLIAAMDELDKLTVHARREGGVLRASVYLKTR